MAYQRISPNYLSWVQEIANKYPTQYEAARERPDGSRDKTFIKILAWELSRRDPRIGLNGKRGGDDISADALAFLNQSGPGGVEVIDVIVGDGHIPSWQDATIEGVLGKYISPTNPFGNSEPENPGNPSGPATSPEYAVDLGPVLQPLLREIAELRNEVAALREKVQSGGGDTQLPSEIMVAIKDSRGKIVAADRNYDGKLIANRDGIGPWERLTLLINP